MWFQRLHVLNRNVWLKIQKQENIRERKTIVSQQQNYKKNTARGGIRIVMLY